MFFFSSYEDEEGMLLEYCFALGVVSTTYSSLLLGSFPNVWLCLLLVAELVLMSTVIEL